MSDPPALKPQPRQAEFLTCQADVCLYGGARGGGKSFALVLDAVRHVKIPRYRAVMVRREFVDLDGEGGLIEEAEHIYPSIGGRLNRASHRFTWDNGARIGYRHMQDDRALQKIQGQQFDRVLPDEATQFPERYFWALLQCARSGPSGVHPRVRMGCNPPGDKDHWLLQFVEPYLDSDGYPNPEMSGVLRWFRNTDAGIDWVREGTKHAMSFAFVPARVEDNAALMERDPTYIAKLENLVSWERERMLHGNWYAVPRSGMYSREQFKVLENSPPGVRWLRYWDQAATEPSARNPNPDHCAGALVGLWEERNALVVADMRRFRVSPGEKRQRMKNTAEADGESVAVWIEQEPAASGKEVAERYVTEDLRGFTVRLDRPTGDKTTRAGPWLAWVEIGRVYVVRGTWNREFFNELEGWPSGKHDQVDAVSGGFAALTRPAPDSTVLAGSATGRPRSPRGRSQSTYST